MFGKIIIVLIALACTSVLASDATPTTPPSGEKRVGGLHPFGSDYVKIPNLTHYPFANPNAPQGGEINLGWMSSYTTKNPMVIGGFPLPGYWLSVQTLAESSFMPDDSLTAYGLLAEWFEVADDHRSMTVKIRDEAMFSDGHPVTADDVVFSWNITADPGYNPAVRLSLQEVESVEKLDSKTVRFHFNAWGRELPITLACQVYIFPQHIYGRPGTSFGKDFNDFNLVGSGPYVIEKDDPSAFVTWKKKPNYWGKKLWHQCGRYNFERITYKIFTENRTLREALKAGQIDVDDVSSAHDWACEFNNQQFTQNHIVKEEFPSSRMPSLQAFVFNTRRAVFSDIRVRKALEAVFDFESLNRNLFYNSYVRQTHFYMAHHLTSEGPAVGREFDELMSLRHRFNKPESGEICVPKDAVIYGFRRADRDMRGCPVAIEDRLKLAGAYLDSAGWLYHPEKKVRMKNGEALRFEVLLSQGSFRRVVNPFFENLAKIGVETTYKEAQPPEYQDRLDKYDFDMIVRTFYPSPCPGVELYSDWSSSSAQTKAGQNMCGVQNPALDALIDSIARSGSPAETYFYAKIFDRVLWSNCYFIPQWYSPVFRGIYWNKFGHTGYFMGEAFGTYNAYNFWWEDSARVNALREAIQKQTPLTRPKPMRLWENSEAQH